MVTLADLYEPLSIVEYNIGFDFQDDELEELETMKARDVAFKQKFDCSNGLWEVLKALLLEFHCNRPLPFQFCWNNRMRYIRAMVMNRALFAIKQKARFKARSHLVKPGPEKDRAYEKLNEALDWALLFIEPFEKRCNMVSKLAENVRMVHREEINLDLVTPLDIEINSILSAPDDEETYHQANHGTNSSMEKQSSILSALDDEETYHQANHGTSSSMKKESNMESTQSLSLHSCHEYQTNNQTLNRFFKSLSW